MDGKNRAMTARTGQTGQLPCLAPDNTVCPTMCFLCLCNKKKPTKGQKCPNTGGHRVKEASEGEETSKARSYLAETKTLRTVRKTKETKTANIITPLHEVKS